ncbi:MAG: serine/threonine-protein kinase, partial [Acidimicrobiales bacterium]|nr:serine/threonine-protein kinase [Acidimicrobiales bacterium]
RELGHGGFADVYLFHQRLPSRDVAIKVLRQTTSSEADRAQFENEANRMAMLSAHPGILTIYAVGVSPDDRPYLTMEYCPHAHFGQMARDQPLTVARALEVGVKIAAAVEIAHRSSILHRDVKPANILLTTYGEPALTDFGIAGGAEGDGLSDSEGVSIPFAAPEVLNGSTSGDELSDVYSLGATIYALLAGRSPFSTDRPLREVELLERVLHETPPLTGRADVPDTLEHVLRTAIARDPGSRYDSAAAFGRALQAAEAELGLAQTPLRIDDVTSIPAPVRTDDDDSTRFKSVQRVDPDAAPAGGTARITRIPDSRPDAPPPSRPRGADPVPVRRSSAPNPDAEMSSHTVRRSAGESEPSNEDVEDDETTDEPEEANGSGRRRLVLSIAGGLFVVVVVAFVVVGAGGGDQGSSGPSTTVGDTAPLVVSASPPRPVDVTVEADDSGGQVIAWTARESSDEDSWQIFFTSGPSDLEGETELVSDTELRIDTDAEVCVTVETIRDGRVSDASTEVCSR